MHVYKCGNPASAKCIVMIHAVGGTCDGNDWNYLFEPFASVKCIIINI